MLIELFLQHNSEKNYFCITKIHYTDMFIALRIYQIYNEKQNY